jgi:hypothetical protein
MKITAFVAALALLCSAFTHPLYAQNCGDPCTVESIEIEDFGPCFATFVFADVLVAHSVPESCFGEIELSGLQQNNLSLNIDGELEAFNKVLLLADAPNNLSVNIDVVADPGNDDSDIISCGLGETTAVIGCPNGSCATDVNLSNVQCNNNGTPDNPNDDFTTFTLNPDGTSTFGYKITGSSDPLTLLNGSPVNNLAHGIARDFKIQNGGAQQNYFLTLSDNYGATLCNLFFVVEAPGSCSNGNEPCFTGTQGAAQCNDNGTSAVSDDFVTFTFKPTGLSSGFYAASSPGNVLSIVSGASALNNIPVNADVTFRLQNGSANGSPFSVVATLVNTTCSITKDFEGVAACSTVPSTCVSNLNLSNVSCNANGSNDTSDDFIRFTLDPEGFPSGVNTYNVTVPGHTVTQFFNSAPATGIQVGPNTTFRLEAGTALSGVYTIVVTASNNSSCTGTVTMEAPGGCPCGGDEKCPTSVEVQNVVCNDNDTPFDPSDDFTTFEILPNTSGSEGGYQLIATNPFGSSVTPSTGTYCDFESFRLQNGSAGGPVVTLELKDNFDGQPCVFEFELTMPEVCSEVCPDISYSVLPADITVECDGNGNVAELNDWLDSQGGAVVAPALTNTGAPTFTVTLLPVSEDNCGGTAVSTYQFTVTNSCGNSATATATFTIVDTTPPMFTQLPESITVSCEGNAEGSADEVLQVWIADYANAAAQDVCSDTELSADVPQVETFCGNTSTYTLIVVATDDCGNTATATATLTIVDNIAPEVSPNCPLQFELFTAAGFDCPRANFFDRTNFDVALGTIVPADFDFQLDGINIANLSDCLSDNCTAADELRLRFESGRSNNTNNEPPGSGCLRNLVTINLSVLDACDNATPVTLTWILRDNVSPVVTTAPQDVTVQCQPGGNEAEFQAWLDDRAGMRVQDACFESSIAVGDIQSDPGCGNTGSRTVQFTPSDVCGNLGETLTATFTIIDTLAPQFLTLPQSVLVECGPDNEAQLAQFIADFAGAVVEDCSEVTWSVSVWPDESGYQCGDNFSRIVQFTVTDACGQSSSATVAFNTIDQTPPTFLQWPQDVTYAANPNYDYGAEYYDWLDSYAGLSATDNCGSVSVQSWIDCTITGCGGTYKRVMRYRVTDECGNYATASATFSIVDALPPVLAQLPDTLRLSCAQDVPTNQQFEAFIRPYLSDDCGVDSVVILYENYYDYCGEIARTFVFKAKDYNSNYSWPYQLVLYAQPRKCAEICSATSAEWADASLPIGNTSIGAARQVYFDQLGSLWLGTHTRTLQIQSEQCLSVYLPAGEQVVSLPLGAGVADSTCELPDYYVTPNGALRSSVAGEVSALLLNMHLNIQQKGRVLGMIRIGKFPECAIPAQVLDSMGADQSIYRLLTISQQYLSRYNNFTQYPYGEALQQALHSINHLWTGCQIGALCPTERDAQERTGTEERAYAPVQIVPNPSHGVGLLYWQSATDRDLSFNISTLDGRTRVVPVSLKAGMNQVEINLMNEPPGMYLIGLPTDQGWQVLKWQKL